jgi:hypothetical protein
VIPDAKNFDSLLRTLLNDVNRLSADVVDESRVAIEEFAGTASVNAIVTPSCAVKMPSILLMRATSALAAASADANCRSNDASTIVDSSKR